jgi:hypothetical protein
MHVCFFDISELREPLLMMSLVSVRSETRLWTSTDPLIVGMVEALTFDLDVRAVFGRRQHVVRVVHVYEDTADRHDE